MNAFRYRRLTAWIALAAMLFAAISSSHARWGAHPGADLAAEVCSASGSAYGTGAPPLSHSPQDHCWLCSAPAKTAAAVQRGPVLGIHSPAAAPPLPGAPALAASPTPLLTPPPRAPPRLA